MRFVPVMVRKVSFFMASRMMRASPSTEVLWPSASRPWGLTKCASAFSAAARAFIMSANAGTLPAMCSATATAASLPLLSISP